MQKREPMNDPSPRPGISREALRAGFILTGMTLVALAAIIWICA